MQQLFSNSNCFFSSIICFGRNISNLSTGGRSLWKLQNQNLELQKRFYYQFISFGKHKRRLCWDHWLWLPSDKNCRAGPQWWSGRCMSWILNSRSLCRRWCKSRCCSRPGCQPHQRWPLFWMEKNTSLPSTTEQIICTAVSSVTLLRSGNRRSKMTN